MCPEGDIRLVNGLVEICRNGVWGFICHYSWDTRDAQVVCRQLGYSTAGIISYVRAIVGKKSIAIPTCVSIGFVFIKLANPHGSLKRACM